MDMLINKIIGNYLNINIDNYFERIDIYLTKPQELNALANLFSYEYQTFDLVSYDKEIVGIVPSDFISENKIIALQKIDRLIYIGIGDIFDIEAIDKIKVMIENYYDYSILDYQIIYLQTEKILKINTLVNSNLQGVIESEERNVKEPNEGGEKIDILNTPVVRIVDGLLEEAVCNNASDIHIEPQEDNIRIRFRIDGVLIDKNILQKQIFDSICARIKVLSGLNISEKRHPQDGRIVRKINNIDYDFRVSTLPTIFGEKIVIRVLDYNFKNLSLDEIGFDENSIFVIKKLLNKPYGIILLTGPTGCGKSTTLYTFLNILNDVNTNIITVEDPVEYRLKGINQIQVNNKIDYTFASILRSILRQDPNVIMIGEIRDEETAIIAFRLAITGHLVLSTLHTNDSVGAIDRLLDLGIPSFFIASSLLGVISQRLVRKLCPECKEEYLSTEEDSKILGIKDKVKLYKKKGCKLCNNTGYLGRIVTNEILYVNNDLRELISKNSMISRIKQKAIKDGMEELKTNTSKLVIKGITSIDELLKITFND